MTEIKLPPLPEPDMFADTCPPMKLFTHNRVSEYGRTCYQAALASPEVQALRKDAERLDFMISEECQIQSLSTPNEVRHRLYWPDADEAQCEWSVNPRAAIDAAMGKQRHD